MTAFFCIYISPSTVALLMYVNEFDDLSGGLGLGLVLRVMLNDMGEILTRMQDFLRLAVTGTERGVEFEVIDVVQEGRANRKEHILRIAMKCHYYNATLKLPFAKRTLNWPQCSNLLKSGSRSKDSSRFCRNWRWNVTISCMLPNRALISALDRNVSRFIGSR